MCYVIGFFIMIYKKYKKFLFINIERIIYCDLVILGLYDICYFNNIIY